MIGIPRILFPVDFSERCATVAPAVKAMAKRFGSEVVVLQVIDLPLASRRSNPLLRNSIRGHFQYPERRRNSRKVP